MSFTTKQYELIKDVATNLFYNTITLDGHQDMEHCIHVAEKLCDLLVQKNIDESLLRRKKNEEQKVEDPNYVES
jgi:hypothetical protein